MAGFFSKLFGGGKKDVDGVQSLVEDTLKNLIELGGFELSFDVKFSKEDNGSGVIDIDFTGADEELLKDKKGQLLDAFQLYVKRVLQHNLPDDRTTVNVDCGGYREESESALIERAENLKMIAIDQGRAVYYRALPPKERKVVHQYLAQDSRVKSRSLGDGLYKKIKIFPVKNPASDAGDTVQND